MRRGCTQVQQYTIKQQSGNHWPGEAGVCGGQCVRVRRYTMSELSEGTSGQALPLEAIIRLVV